MEEDIIDSKLTGFIQSFATNPLQASKKHNLAPQNAKFIEAEASARIQDNLGKKCMDNVATTSKCFKCMYLIPRNPELSVGLAKKHHVFIIQLLEAKNLVWAMKEIQTLHQWLNKLAHSRSINWADSSISVKNMISIEYVELENDQLSNLIVAFHFLVLQCILQYLSSNIGNVIRRRDQIIDLTIFKHVSIAFLNEQNLIKWIHATNQSQVNNVRYRNNCVKMIKGFLKLLGSIASKVDNADLKIYRSCLLLKLVEYTGNVDQDMKGFELYDEVLPFLEDLRKVGDCEFPPLIERITSSMSISTDTIINSDNTEIPVSSTDVIMTLTHLNTNPSIGLVNQLNLQFIHSKSDVLSDDPRIFELINRFSLTNTATTFAFINTIIAFVESFSLEHNRMSKTHLLILDSFTVFIKDVLAEDSTHALQLTVLKTLYRTFKHLKQMKRIRNLSNLLYNLGIKSKLVVAWNLSAEFEYFIHYNDPSDENLNYLKSKIPKVVNALSELGYYQQASVTLVQLLELIQSSGEFSVGSAIIQLVAKCTSSHPKFICTILGDSKLSDESKLAMTIELFGAFEKSTDSRGKTMAVNTLMSSLRIEQDHLRLLAQYYYYDTNGLEGVLTFNDNLEILEHSNPLIATGILLQHLIHFDWDDSKLNRAIENCTKWVSLRNRITIRSYEMDIFKLFLSFLNFNGHTGHAIILISDLKSTSFSLPPEHRIFLESELCQALRELSLQKEVSDSLIQWNSLLKEFKIASISEVLAFNITQFQYCVDSRNTSMAKEKFNKILRVLKSKPEYNLSSNVKLPMIEKLQNILLIAKFQLITSSLNISLNNHFDAFDNAKLSIKLLYSIIKSSVSTIPKSKYLEVKWQTVTLLFRAYRLMIDISKSLGVSRDFLYYLSEFKKVNDGSNAPVINCINWFGTIIYNVLLNNHSEVELTYNRINELTKLPLVRNNLSVVALSGKVMKIIGKKTESTDFRMPKFASLKSIPRITLQSIYSVNCFFEKDCLFLLGENEQDMGDEERGPLHNLVETKSKVKGLLKSLLDLPGFQILDSSVRTTPSIVNEGLADLSNFDLEVADQLIRCKEMLQAFLVNDQLSQLTAYQQKALTQVFNQCLSLLSSISIFKTNTTILIDLYYLQDLTSSLSFINDRRINHSSNGPSDLLPNEIRVDSTIDKSFSTSSMAFNIDLNLYLPENWSIFTIDRCSTSGDLLLSKFRKGSQPLFLRLPFRKSTGNNDLTINTFESVSEMLKEIILQSDLSTKRATTSKVQSKDDRKNWWKLRFSLDLKMRDLLTHVEEHWIGGFKGLFSDHSSDMVFEKFKNDFVKIFKSSLPTRKHFDAGAKFMQFDDAIIKAFYDLSHYNRADIEDLLLYIIDTLTFHGEKNEYQEINFDKLHRSLEALYDKYSNLRSKMAREHTVIVPSSSCAFFPWESLPCLQGKSISRMPSIHLLIELLKQRSDFSVQSSSKLFYVINPSGDLVRTEEKLKPNFIANSHWNGLVGEKPKEEPFLEELFKTNLFVYSGHGGCDQYFRTSSLYKRSLPNGPKLPPSLLIGCSSGALKMNGMLEPKGNIYNWITCGAPMVLVNLWDVTDKDIDQFSMSVFQKWGLFSGVHNKVNICEAVLQSRDSCNLRYLNGAAPIVYGLPLHLE